MTDSFDPQVPNSQASNSQALTKELKELAAGYVLGDLSSEEAERFHQVVSKLPALKAEVHSLQQTLEMIPYALPKQQPNAELRARTLQAIQAEAEATLSASIPSASIPSVAVDESLDSSAYKEKRERISAVESLTHQSDFQPLAPKELLRKRVAWVVSGLAIGCAMTVGVGMVKDVRLLPRFAIAAFSDQNIDQGIDQVWAGFSYLAQDHNTSISEVNGPADFVTQQASDVLSYTSDFSTTLAALPVLPEEKGQLLGSSNCKFGKTKGIRLSYRLSNVATAAEVGSQSGPQSGDAPIVSAYQLELDGAQFPNFHNSYIMLRQADGTNIVLWREDSYVYALVAALPPTDLNNLAQSVGHI